MAPTPPAFPPCDRWPTRLEFVLVDVPRPDGRATDGDVAQRAALNGAWVGWGGGYGPAVTAAEWPRTAGTGRPMMHAVTTALPPEAGMGHDGVAIFQGDDALTLHQAGIEAGVEEVGERGWIVRDRLAGEFAVLFLSSDRLAQGAVEPPSDALEPRQIAEIDTFPVLPLIGFAEPDDENPGVAPGDPDRVSPYRPVREPGAEPDLKSWARYLSPNHLGGTTKATPPPGPEFSPTYLEFEELFGLSIADGALLIDLAGPRVHVAFRTGLPVRRRSAIAWSEDNGHPAYGWDDLLSPDEAAHFGALAARVEAEAAAEAARVAAERAELESAQAVAGPDAETARPAAERAGNAWDLVFEGDDEGFGEFGNGDQSEVDGDPAGWIGSPGPGIAWENWPRSEDAGFPMLHVCTLRLPVEHQTKGPGYPGVALFMGEGQFGNRRLVGDASSDDPYLADLGRAVRHPMALVREDEIGGQYQLVWLTEGELSAGPTAPHPDVRRDGAPEDDSEGANAWDDVEPLRRVWLVERDDPNAGEAPVEARGERYLQPFNTETSRFEPWAEALFGRCHLGGTAFPVQGMPDGLTPTYLELGEISGLNLGGGGTLQIDLSSETFDWACG